MKRAEEAPARAGEPEFAEEEQPQEGRAWLRRLAGSNVWIFLILGGICLVFALLSFDAFASTSNIRNITVDAAVLLVLAVGSTFVIITAGIDLSVGSVLVFSGVVSAKLMEAVGGESTGVILLGLVAALGSGFAWGLFNGVVIAKLKVPALIVTLGSFGAALGFAQLITDGVDVRDVPFPLVESVGTGLLFDQIPYLVLIAGGVALFFAIVLALTRFGRHTYAVGSNEEAARRAGINVDLHLIKIYALAGTLSGLAGFMSLARFATTTIAGHSTDNLQAIAAVVIGGTSIIGGRGTVLGTLLGALLVGTVSSAVTLLSWPSELAQLFIGVFILVAVGVDLLRERRRSAR